MIKHSIIIPTSGRPSAIISAINFLLVTSPELHHAEILVIDNNESEELSADLSAYCQSIYGKIHYFRETSPGLTAARHRGFIESQGDILTFLDDDVEVSSSWLSAIQNAFLNPEVALVGGPSIPNFTSSIPSWFWDYFTSTPYGGWMCGWLSLLDIGHDVININPNYIWGLNFSIRKSVLKKCRGFHPDLVPFHMQRWQGDGETGLTQKIKTAGYRSDYVQDALVRHLCGSDRLNIEYFKKRAFYQGVCDSFTQIRAGQTPLSAIISKENVSAYKHIKFIIGKIFRQLKNKGSYWAIEGSTVKKLTDQANHEGWLFHQREVAADSALLAWVRQPDYIDAVIPKVKMR